MIDVHVHFLHNATGEYTFELLDKIVNAALASDLEEVCLLEHTHQYFEFEKVYKPIRAYNEYQANWVRRRMEGSIENYLGFIERARKKDYPVKIKYGLEVCYIPETEGILAGILDEYEFDFLTGSVHYIDNWGFDHKSDAHKPENTGANIRELQRMIDCC